MFCFGYFITFVEQMETFRQKLKLAIHKKGWTIDKFANKMGWNNRSGFYALTKNKSINPLVIDKICKLLGVEKEYFENDVSIPAIYVSNKQQDTSDIPERLSAAINEITKELESLKILIESKNKYIESLEEMNRMLKDQIKGNLERHKALG